MNIDQVKISDDLVDIAAQCNHNDWDEEGDAELLSYTTASLKEYLKDRNNIMVAAYDGAVIAGIAIGYVLVHPSGSRTLYIDELDVRPGYRRRGIATNIVKHYRIIARNRHCNEIWLSTNIQNKYAQMFYR